MSVLSPEHSLAPAAPPPTLRLLPVPVSEPPFDDELPPRSAISRAPLGPLRALPPLRLVPAPAPDEEEDEQIRYRTALGDLPPSRPVARALVQGLLEVLAGVRPLAQLRRRTSPELYATLELAVAERRPSTGLRPTSDAVRSLHIQERPEGVAEVCATVRRGSRAAAVALRMEGGDGQWCCTDVAGL